MNTYEGWNKNPELWKSIEDVISNIEKTLTKSWNSEKFKNFYLSTSVTTQDQNFQVIGKYAIQKNIVYIENRNGLNKKKWSKEKQEIENNLRIFFEDFKLPEQSSKPIVNPLLNKTVSATLEMQDYISKVFTYDELAKILSLKDSIYSDRLSFSFSIYKNQTSLKDNVKSGINEIEDNNEVTLIVNVSVIISSPIDYCCQVINSKILSESIFYNYLNTQLQAYFGYKNYPNKKINVIEVKNYPFELYKLSSEHYRIDYNSKRIVYIPKEDLSYDSYIQETKKLYDSNKKELIGELYDLNTLKNRVIFFDKITSQLIYTDEFALIQRLDLSQTNQLSQERINYLLKSEINSEEFQTFLDILKNIYYRLDLYNKEDFDEVLTKVNSFSYIYELTSSNCPEFFNILNSCYNSWDDINYNLILKISYKIYLELLLFSKIEDINNLTIQNLTTLNLDNNKILPVELVQQLKNFYKNQLINFPLEFRDTYYISKISLLLKNNLINRAAIITKQDLEVYNRLQIISNGNYNGLILNSQTIKSLYEDFGDNLITYLITLPKNTIYIINPEIFFESSILGNTELYQANKLSFRYLIINLLKSISLDYTVFYKDFDIYSNKFIVTCLRQLFAGVKHKEIYGFIDNKDMSLLDANCFDVNEAINFGSIQNIQVLIKSILPKIESNTYFVDTTKNQEQYYKELVNLSTTNLKNDKDFQTLVLNSDYNKSQELTPYISNFLSISNIFLNVPDNDLFSYKDKFDDEENLNLISGKLDILYSILASNLYGGLVNGIKKQSKSGSTLVICENRIVRDYLYKNLNHRFFGEVCYKFISGSEKEIREFKGKKIGFITKDILFNGIVLDNISSYIITQTSFYEDYLEEYSQYIYYNAINTFAKDVEVSNIIFDNTLEVNNYVKSQVNFLNKKLLEYIDFPQFNKYLSGLKDIPEFPNTYDDIEIFSYDKTQVFNLDEKLNSIYEFEKEQEEELKNKYQEVLLKKLGCKVSEQDLYDIIYTVLKNDNFLFGSSAYIPFINNMYLSERNLIPYQVNEKFSDINGNAYYYKNSLVQKNLPIYTEYGTGYVLGDNTFQFDVNIIGSKEFLVSKDLIYIPNPNSIENYMDYIKSISTYGDSKIDINLLEEKKIHKKTENIELDQADNSVSLSVNRINGEFSLYTTNIDIDNIRLEDFNFSKYSNIFIASISNEQDFSNIIEKLQGYRVNQEYLNVVKQCYKEWTNGKEFLLPVKYNYFSTNHIMEENPKVYCLVWNKNFYIIWNGNFYQKLGMKLSRKFNITLIKSLYIQQYKESKTCKYELLKISKTLNIVNLQELLNYFNQDFPKLNYLEVITLNKQDKNASLMEFLKDKESKLKERIKELRREKYGKDES